VRLGLALVIALAALAGSAAAAPSPGHQKLVAAQDAEKKGDADAAHGRATDARVQWTAAATAYQAAIDAGEDIAVNVALAVVEDKLGRYTDAYKHLQLVASANIKPDVTKKAQIKLDDLSARVGTVKLTIVPDGAQIAIAGTTVGTSPLAEPLLLAPGNYTATVTAQGYQPKDVELKLQAGSEIDKKVTLEAVPIAVAGVHEAPPPAPPSPKPSYVPLMIGGGVTLGFAVAATLTGIAAIHQHDTFVDPGTDAADRDHAQSTGRLEAHLTDAFIVGAIATAAVTAGWYYFKGSSDHETAKVGVAPWVQSDVGGMIAAGSF
jgi:PEGA domain